MKYICLLYTSRRYFYQNDIDIFQYTFCNSELIIIKINHFISDMVVTGGDTYGSY